jgi:uncharacterized protein
MQLAVNYTPQAADLLAAGRVEFDLYKCPDWSEVIAEATRQRPAYVHFPLYAGGGQVCGADWDRIDGILKQTGTRYVNIHLAPHSDDFPGMPPDTEDPTWNEPVLERIIADVEFVKARYGAERIILENVPWDPVPQFSIPRPAILAENISLVVHETGCGFLLDTAHAQIAANYLQMDGIDYLNALPVDHLREIHVTGTKYSDEIGCLIDHYAMSASDWALAEHALTRIGRGDWPPPEIVALEYGGVGPLFEWRSESEIIAAELPHLAALVTAARSRLGLMPDTVKGS